MNHSSMMRTIRNPVKSLRSPFLRLKRAGNLISFVPVIHDPPRVMCELQIPRPHALPSTGASRYDRFMQSAVHSDTLPVVSYKPKELALKEPTGAVPNTSLSLHWTCCQ